MGVDRYPAYRVREPVLELLVALEDVGHEETEQAPELHPVGTNIPYIHV